MLATKYFLVVDLQSSNYAIEIKGHFGSDNNALTSGKLNIWSKKTFILQEIDALTKSLKVNTVPTIDNISVALLRGNHHRANV